MIAARAVGVTALPLAKVLGSPASQTALMLASKHTLMAAVGCEAEEFGAGGATSTTPLTVVGPACVGGGGGGAPTGGASPPPPPQPVMNRTVDVDSARLRSWRDACGVRLPP